LGPKNEYGDPGGGRSLLEGSAEFRISISKIVVFSLFADAGNVWAGSFNYHLNDLHYAAGTGIKVKTPIGPVGLDFARPIFDSETQWQIHLNIGHSF
jgi:outer membrane protein insertion porin family